MNFTISLQPSNSLSAILKNILELEEWTNRTQISASEPIGNYEGHKDIYQTSLYFKERCLQNVSIFVQIFNLYLAT
jgi:hypothetical protein